MNNQGNQFNQGNQNFQPTQPQQGFVPPAQNRQYAAPKPPKPPKAPGAKGRWMHITMIALGGVVVFFSLFSLFSNIEYCVESLTRTYRDSYKLSNFAGSLIYIVLGAALIFIALERLLDPQRKGLKPTLSLIFDISALSLACITAIFGLIHLFDTCDSFFNSLKYISSRTKVTTLVGSFTFSLFILAGCAVVIIYFLPKLLDLIKSKKITLGKRPVSQNAYRPQPGQYGTQMPVPPTPPAAPGNNNNQPKA